MNAHHEFHPQQFSQCNTLFLFYVSILQPLSCFLHSHDLQRCSRPKHRETSSRYFANRFPLKLKLVMTSKQIIARPCRCVLPSDQTPIVSSRRHAALYLMDQVSMNLLLITGFNDFLRAQLCKQQEITLSSQHPLHPDHFSFVGTSSVITFSIEPYKSIAYAKLRSWYNNYGILVRIN